MGAGETVAVTMDTAVRYCGTVPLDSWTLSVVRKANQEGYVFSYCCKTSIYVNNWEKLPVVELHVWLDCFNSLTVAVTGLER